MKSSARDRADDPQWVSERQRETDAYFAARPDIAGVPARVEHLALQADRPLPVKAGERWFTARRRAYWEPPVVTVRDHGSADERAVIDLAGWTKPETPWLDWWYPSPDGRRIAFGVSAHRSELSVLYVVDVDSGGLGPERIPNTSFAVVAWLPDSSGFYYNRSRGSDFVAPQKAIFFHRPGEPVRDEPEPAVTWVDEEYAYPQLSGDGRWLAAFSGDIQPRPDAIRDLAAGTAWRPFLIDFPGTFIGDFDGEDYVCVTTDGAPRGRVVRLPIETARERSTWRELVAEGDGTIRQVSVSGERLIVVDLIESEPRIRICTTDGDELDTVPLPAQIWPLGSAVHGYGMMDGIVRNDGGSVAFVASGFATPPAEYTYDFESRTLTRDGDAPAPIAEVHAEFVRLPAVDGREIGYWVVEPAAGDRPRPAMVYGYGGWNIAMGTPGFLAEFLTFVEAGGAVVLPHLRGDGTYGDDFWHEGRLEHKQRTFDDVISVARHLIDSGTAEAGRMALVGASNGGLLVTAAITQHPELFRAAMPLVPLTDMLEYTRDAYPGEFRTEYGDPADPRMREALAAYSPLHAVQPGRRYPSVLVVCGDHDLRCPDWHSRRFVAAMREATGSGDHPVMLRIVPHTGHMTASSLSAPDWLAFAISELGMTAHDPALP
ncbi:MAG TPA: prolyl oligopeptidase family serine peptidase [Gaiellales bacterium]|nr:prolyl oligopeptidase family serine peptidase [Gaiellales bacterium]